MSTPVFDGCCSRALNDLGDCRFVTYVVTLGLTSGQEKILCGDLMFSGHTVVLTIMYFTQLQYTPRRLVALRYIATPITFFGIAALVVSGGSSSRLMCISWTADRDSTQAETTSGVYSSRRISRFLSDST